VAYSTGLLGPDALATVLPEPLTVPPELPALALAALDRAVAEDSEWRQLWADTDDAMSELDTIRRALQEVTAETS
jgi:hypothetical protein